jgi:NTP pyrophosphatase (non-canonical NTP hydrolase)
MKWVDLVILMKKYIEAKSEGPYEKPSISGFHAAADAIVAEGRDARQRKVVEWGLAAFGREQVLSVEQRGLRLLEEALEAAQAAGVSAEDAMKLAVYVYGRPVGELRQEIGGVGITLLALANAAGVSADDQEVIELNRVLSKPKEHWAARNQAKNDAGFLAKGIAS